MKKITLKVDAVPHWHAVGISSAERDYRLCYLINKSLGMSFAKEGILQVYVPEEEPAGLFGLGESPPARKASAGKAENVRKEVPAFVHEDTESRAVYYLLKNRQENFHIIPKWKKADYILLAGDEASQTGLDKLSHGLARIPDIQSTFAIPTDQTFHIDVE